MRHVAARDSEGSEGEHAISCQEKNRRKYAEMLDPPAETGKSAESIGRRVTTKNEILTRLKTGCVSLQRGENGTNGGRPSTTPPSEKRLLKQGQRMDTLA